MLYLPTQHIPLNCTAAHCTVAAVWLTLFHITFLSCLSLPADCHLLLGGHSFRCSSVTLTLLVWQLTRYTSLCHTHSCTPLPQNKTLLPVFFFWNLNYSSLSQAFIVISQVLQSCMSQIHTLLYLSTTIPLVAPIFCLHYTCGYHPCMVWLPYNISPSAHICHMDQHSVSVSPHHLIAQLPTSFPIQTVLHLVPLN